VETPGFIAHVNSALVGRLSEVSYPFKRSRYAAKSNGACLIPLQILVVHEKERLIVAVVNFGNRDRPAKRKTEIVLAEMGFFRANGILIPRVGVEHIVEHVLVHTTV